MLTGGRPTPPVTEPRQRGEGVAIALSSPAVRVWRAGRQQWKAWSSRLVTATLQSGKANSDRIHILSCYAPTFSASRTDKNKFLDDLQQALDAASPSECYVITGDFNARVGSRTSVDDQWAGVRGPHGLEETNEAGRELSHQQYVTPGFPRGRYTSTHGSTASQRGGTVLNEVRSATPITSFFALN